MMKFSIRKNVTLFSIGLLWIPIVISSFTQAYAESEVEDSEQVLKEKDVNSCNFFKEVNPDEILDKNNEDFQELFIENPQLEAYENEIVSVSIQAKQPIQSFKVSLSDKLVPYFDESSDILCSETDENGLILYLKKEMTTFSLQLVASEIGDYNICIFHDQSSVEVQLSILSSMASPSETKDSTKDTVSFDEREENNVEDLEDNKHPEPPLSIIEHQELLSELFLGIEIGDNSKHIVTSDNLSDYFQTNGTAEIDHDSGVVTLTQDAQNQSGAITLKQPMLADYPFMLRGTINLGNKSQQNRGADGMGIGFHTSPAGSIGQTGNGMGLAGLKDAFGFKLDTYYNSSSESFAAADPDDFKNVGSILNRRNVPFAGYVYSDNGLLKTYMGEESPAVQIPDPENNEFKAISIIYNPSPTNKILSVLYNNHIYHVDVSKWIPSQQKELSFLISAATGSATNLHQIHIDRMEYVSEPEEYEFIDVTPENIEKVFNVNGSAEYLGVETNNGKEYMTYKLTDDIPNQNGSIVINSKISNNLPFSISGRVHLGNKSQGSIIESRNGADGLSFGFHSDTPSKIAQTEGNGVGLAGLSNAFGFKLDTNYNSKSGTYTEADPREFSGSGLVSTPHAFGGYIFTNDNNKLETFMGSEAIARRISEPNNTWRTFQLNYNPGEHNKILTIQYNGDIWHKDVTDWQPSDLNTVTFQIGAATGGNSNWHGVQIEKMQYVIGEGEVKVNYKDIDTDENILPPKIVKEKLTKEVYLDPQNKEKDEVYEKGYDLVKSEGPSSYNKDTYMIYVEEHQQEVTYYYRRATSQVDIHFVDMDNKQLREIDQKEGFVGDTFNIEPILIEHYEFRSVQDDLGLQHTFTREKKKIYLVYECVLSTSPKDPLNPSVDIEPENKPELPQNQGLLSIDFVSQFDFGKQMISAQDKYYYAKPQRLLDTYGTIIDGEERPNYVQVSDRRSGSDRNGWTLSVTQRYQFINFYKHELIGARISLNNQQFASIKDNDSPTLSNPSGVTLVPGQKTTLVTAKNQEGAGTWIYRFGDEKSAGESIVLEVPRSATPDSTAYETRLTWELSAVPENN